MSYVVCLGEALIDFVADVSGVTLAECPGFRKAAGGAPWVSNKGATNGQKALPPTGTSLNSSKKAKRKAQRQGKESERT